MTSKGGCLASLIKDLENIKIQANKQLQEGNTENAIENWRKGLSLCNERFEELSAYAPVEFDKFQNSFRSNLVLGYQKLDKFEEAIKCAEIVLKQFPNNCKVRYRKALCLLMMNEWEQAHPEIKYLLDCSTCQGVDKVTCLNSAKILLAKYNEQKETQKNVYKSMFDRSKLSTEEVNDRLATENNTKARFCSCWQNETELINESKKSIRLSEGYLYSGRTKIPIKVKEILPCNELWNTCLRCFHSENSAKNLKSEEFRSSLLSLAVTKEDASTEDNRQLTTSLPMTILFVLHNLLKNQDDRHFEKITPKTNFSTEMKSHLSIHIIGVDGRSEMHCSFRHLLSRLHWEESCSFTSPRDLVLVNVGFLSPKDQVWAETLQDGVLSKPLVAYLEDDRLEDPSINPSLSKKTRVQLAFNYKGYYHDFVQAHPGIMPKFTHEETPLPNDQNKYDQISPNICVLPCPNIVRNIKTWLPTLRILLHSEVLCIITVTTPVETLATKARVTEAFLEGIGANIILPLSFNKFPIYLKTETDGIQLKGLKSVVAKHGAILCFRGMAGGCSLTALDDPSFISEVIKKVVKQCENPPTD